jgi:gluconokinase
MPVIVIMGVSGSGKSVVGKELSVRLNVPFCEGDDLHPAANIAKMKMGKPLDDVDRAPWLARVASWIDDHRAGGVVTCSALRRRYRDRLRRGQIVPPSLVLLNPPCTVLEVRLDGREGHFMPASLLHSQLRTLELPSFDEEVLVLAGTEQVDLLVHDIAVYLQRK